MKKVSMFAIAFLCLVSFSNGQEQKQKTEKLESKAETVKRAKFIDFSSELGVPISSLDKLGERIDSARIEANPVELAGAANLLKASESLSGKTASLTSKDLQVEAVELAKNRGSSAELLIIAKMFGGPEAKELTELASAIAEKNKTEEGESSRDIHGTLRVTNRGHNEVHIYVNGHEIGHVHGHSTRSFYVRHAVVLVARDHYGHRWERHLHHGHYHNWHWRLNPPHYHGH